MDDVWGDDEDDDDHADWRDDPTLTDTARQALEALERAAQGPPPPDHDPVFQEFCSGAIARKLAMVRDERERILADYDATVFKARQAGMSWGEIGRRLGVSRQQLHRSYAGRCMPEEPI
ncbi:hypothetical protein HZU40_31225 [Mycolicibacterium fluoranthenivorans]|uniref:Uncharacterized protein n=1 Tax=Mycolicibacterium fluoranthenivorans TaxID=258505 RepID=A0A7G8PDY2_9MYCO|nr:hypothetical protein [Mycolicibacterium fluoranthenivorans]QNJ92548.1 hypothetical protein HZU40_31225 [Mycolicibacterium fluoranthenivorans]